MGELIQMSDYKKHNSDPYRMKCTFIEVYEGYTIKHDPFRDMCQFTAIGPNGRIGPDVSSFETALDLVDGDRQGLDPNFVLEAIG